MATTARGVRFGAMFPFGKLFVNTVGSFFMALVMGILLLLAKSTNMLPESLRLLLTVGFDCKYINGLYADAYDIGLNAMAELGDIRSYEQATDEEENVAAGMLVSAMLHRCDMGEDDLDE
jgi:hypothetical protein